MMKRCWWYPRELLQTSDLNQPPLETFLRGGTKLSPQTLSAIKINNILWSFAALILNHKMERLKANQGDDNKDVLVPRGRRQL